MSRSVNSRKLEHLQAVAKDAEIERLGSGFDSIELTHRALPEIGFDEIDLSTDFLDKPLSMPLIISSMTGGDSEEILRINRHLAQGAEQTGVAMAVGSQRVMFSRTGAHKSFALREFAPTVPLIGNLGAVQLNNELGIEHCQKAIDILDADGLYFHLNPLQEAVQPEGDLNFSGLSGKISEIISKLDKPVLLKEVGCGLSPADIELGLKAGVTIFDLAGRGGTSWSRIEYHRRARSNDDIGLVFQDWGMTTVEALRRARPFADRAMFVASGGIRSGIDMAKALILGAQVCGVAAPFLAAARHSARAVADQIEVFRRELKTALFLLGCKDCDSLRNNLSLVL